ncbi:hypothetical protein CANINC_003979 [Pichia inconspicua]|uniref:Uncharacterized protein n=1 Tax=Pichia inconspicua TaxID=52247 RepID=A0A4T0WXA6_9ASCO|nr:hypothetical protein CANINC_003979 [[Candida] inconspicua]
MVAKQELKLQCNAITKKGTRCKWNALPNEKVCHVHIKMQNVSKDLARRNSKPMGLFNLKSKDMQQESRNRKEEGIGNIYVYTYGHMLHKTPTQTPYLHLAMPTKNNWLDKSKTLPFDTSENILIKVGYTRKRPEVRVKEWKEQCGHSDFVLLHPGSLVPQYGRKKSANSDEIFGLRKLFQKLTVADKSIDTHRLGQFNSQVSVKMNLTGRRYKHLNEEKTCFVTTNPYQVEQNIHRILRQKFGTGKLYCEGCMKKRLDLNNRLVASIGVHTEWFLIPRNHLSFLWDIIESQCSSPRKTSTLMIF